ncbi:trafficking protein particle complex subunit 10 [Papiliotrema laurentii]|uniref:Trafficking protein particle complex subunit 10 n=1 Tax=Papiliotrema laurentii TaxID=5418 RepID=A0AAD9FTV8_PAPLA|nr:trafficking protein particle complex subunit 10 [Papiliotrema laurentii]
MPPRSVTVTYTLHPAPPPNASASSSSSPLLAALEGIRAQTPLTNLHWKPTSRTALRTIQTADVDLVELGEAGTAGKEVAGSVLEWPLTNLCLVMCESDEVYKTQTRSFIRDWLSLLAARRNSHAPLIVLVNSASAAASSGKNVFGRDKGVIAKLRTDFNTSKRDRCVQVNLPPDGRADPAVWVEVINKLKESIVSALDSAVLEREEDVKRGEAQRLTVGWNFCTWFLLKESLAHSFEGVNLNEDALVVYEELEAAFLQVLKEQNLSWFGKLGATGPRDDSLPILDTTTKPYREMLQTSSISIFDFRIYVFARQAQLLGKLGRITEIAKRGQWFVASLTRRLRENEADLAENFIESWTYTACMDIVRKCDEWSRIDRPNGDYSGLIAYESARSELLDIARTQVERIGVAVGHLPDEYPFAPSSTPAPVNDDVLFESSDNGLSDGPGDDTPSPRSSLSNQQLLAAIADKANFQALYTTLTKRTITAYQACNKVNSVIRLKADLAALALLKEDWISAYDLCRDLARDCAEQHIWEPASRFALAGAIRAHQHLTLDKHEDWTNLALAYLRTCAIVADQPSSIEVERVLEGFREQEIEYTAEHHRAFEVRVDGDLAAWTDEPGVSSIKVAITNLLSNDVSFDMITLDLEDGAHEGIAFTAVDGTLKPGENIISASCHTSITGLFSLNESRISIGKVVFMYRPEAGSRVRLPRDARGPKTTLRMPFDIALDKESTVVVEIHSGEVDLRDARVVLVSEQEDVHYKMESASCKDAAIQASQDEIVLGDVKSGRTVHVVVPYSGSAAAESSRSRTVLRYLTGTGESRAAIDHHQVSMSLPLSVNVQDFFRPKCLVSHFTIASDGREQLRIGSVRLDEGDQRGYEVESARKEWDRSTMITPSQPLSCLFKIRKKQSDASAVLRLVIRYRGIPEEISSACRAASRQDSPVARAALQVLSHKGAWLPEYLATGKLGEAFEAALRSEISLRATEDVPAFVQAANEALASEAAVDFWRTLEIPVDVPQQRLLTTVRFEQKAPVGTIYEGRAVSLDMSFTSTFDWLGSETGVVRGGSVELVWDVAVSQDDWIVLGRKKGHYTTQGDTPSTQTLVLVPVRAGRLFLPTVHVQLFRPSSSEAGSRASRRDSTSATTELNGGEDGAAASEEVTCETFVENAAEVVDVLPATKARTVLVPIQPRDGWVG